MRSEQFGHSTYYFSHSYDDFLFSASEEELLDVTKAGVFFLIKDDEDYYGREYFNQALIQVRKANKNELPRPV